MRVCVIGAGYVGLVTAAGLADFGNDVICVDINKSKIENLKKGIMPFFEPGLAELVNKNKSRLSFSGDISGSVKKSEIIIIAVGTPALAGGAPDMKNFWSAARVISQNLNDRKIIVVKSTVPPGTNKELSVRLAGWTGRDNFDVVSSPEILRQGSALKDFFNPNFIISGSNSAKAGKAVAALFRGSKIKKDKLIFTAPETAELIKYAVNTFLALKISYINELANLSESIGADISEVARIIGLDPRIGPLFLKAGVGFGGSCLPKDVKALLYLAASKGVATSVLASPLGSNKIQKQVAVKKLTRYLSSLKGKKIAVWGLSFKPGTDDMREAPSIDIIAALQRKGAKVIAYDPYACAKAKAILSGVQFSLTAYGALKNSDALLILTEWSEFENPDYDKMKKLMKRPLVIDGRNVLDPKAARRAGFEYEGIGRK